VLVRHAPSRVDPSRPPREWDLSDDGRGAAQRLCALGLFDQVHGYYAGPEPKLEATLAPVAAAHGKQVESDPAFGETVSEGWFGAEEFVETVRRFFAAPGEPAAPGWERADNAVARFGAGVERLRARHAPDVRAGHVRPGTFAIASGGRALTAYLAHLLGYTPDQAFTAWRALRMPDLCVVQLEPDTPPRLVIPFGALGA
jgi:broad specificity phosphatase PhoE